VELSEARTTSTSRVFVVRLSDSRDLFTVGAVPPNETDCYQFVGAAPPLLILQNSTGMISKASSTLWNKPTLIRFQVSQCADSTGIPHILDIIRYLQAL